MKKENDFLLIKNIKGDLIYTGRGDRQPNRETLFTKILPKLVD